MYGRNPTPADHACHIAKPATASFFDAAACVCNAKCPFGISSSIALLWRNNDHNGPECRAMAKDPKFTMDMRNATTHEGTGGNPNVDVPVGFVRPPPFSWSSPLSLSTCLPCSRADTCLSPLSLISSAKHNDDPNEDTCATSLLRPKSEGTKPVLVPESAWGCICLPPSVFLACLSFDLPLP